MKTLARIGLSALALSLSIAIVPGAYAVDAATTPSSKSLRKAQKAGKARDAMATGVWQVGKGESLLQICRYLSSDPATRRRLSVAILEENPDAFVDGDRTKLIVGARLKLPPGLVVASATDRTSPSPQAAAAVATAPAAIGGEATGEALANGTAPGSKGLANGNGNRRRNGGTNGAALPEPAEQAYRDQLISGTASEPDEEEAPKQRSTAPGLQSWTIDYRYDFRESAGLPDSAAHGIAILHSRETERHGDFTLDAQIGHMDLGPLVANVDGRISKVTLTHDRFAVAHGVTASSALGVTRTNMMPWLGTSYRVSIPTTFIAGFSTIVESPGMTWNASIGEIGRLLGLNVQGFERTSGRTATLGVATEPSAGWKLAANAVGLRGSDLVPDHSAITAGAEYRQADQGHVRLQGVVDDEQRKGFWADGTWREGRAVHRLGGYQIDPETRYGEGYLLNDTRALYYRGDFRHGYDFLSLGIDATQSNLDRRPERGGEESLGAYGSATLRLDRTMSAGGSLSVRRGEPRVGHGARLWNGSANVFLSRKSDLGLSRFDLAAAGVRPTDGGRTQYTRSITWNQNWPDWRGLRWSTLVTLGDERLEDRKLRQAILSASVNGTFAQDLRWDASLTAVNSDDGITVDRNYNATVGIDWNVARHWYLNLQWYRSQVRTTSTLLPSVPFVRDNQVQLIARYEESWGTPYPRLGGPAGRSGTGTVTGWVFFDENGDGVRQPTERGAPGITVFLERRQAQVTDREGRFTFPLVPSGNRSLSIAIDRVPLPWGLADESPRTVEVPVRGEGRIEIGLSRISP